MSKDREFIVNGFQVTANNCESNKNRAMNETKVDRNTPLPTNTDITRPVNSPQDSEALVELNPLPLTEIPGPENITTRESKRTQTSAGKKLRAAESVVVEVGKVAKASPILEFAHSDRRVLCISLSIILGLTFASLVIAISSVFRGQSNLAMERTSYWWYFIFTLLILAYIWISFSLINSQHPDSTSLMMCCILAAILTITELIVITRFFFVTFPYPDMGECHPFVCSHLTHSSLSTTGPQIGNLANGLNLLWSLHWVFSDSFSN